MFTTQRPERYKNKIIEILRYFQIQNEKARSIIMTKIVLNVKMDANLQSQIFYIFIFLNNKFELHFLVFKAK